MDNYEKEIELYFELKDAPESSRESYLRRIKAFMLYLENNQKSVDDFTISDIQQYMLHLKKEKGLKAGTINNYISSIRFFYIHVLDKEWSPKKVPRMRRVSNLPAIMAKEDLLSFLGQITNLKYKTILALMYSSGLRVSEVVKLRICDVCSKTMTLRIEGAKHGTNRHAILSATALELLRQYFKKYLSNTDYKKEDWLFPGQETGNHLSVKSIKNTIIKLRNRLEMDQRISSHSLRHCFAVHSLEDGVEPVVIQQLLGHKSFHSTSMYLRMTSKSLMGTKSPLDTGGDLK